MGCTWLVCCRYSCASLSLRRFCHGKNQATWMKIQNLGYLNCGGLCPRRTMSTGYCPKIWKNSYWLINVLYRLIIFIDRLLYMYNDLWLYTYKLIDVVFMNPFCYSSDRSCYWISFDNKCVTVLKLIEESSSHTYLKLVSAESVKETARQGWY